MNVTLTGASGFLGTRLLQKLKSVGHNVHVLGRKPVQGLPFSHWDAESSEPPAESLAAADAIVHLAGEPVAQRWTPEVKKRIRSSRVEGTRNLVHALSTLSTRPSVLVSASAIGIYGSRGDEILTETSSPGDDFLAEVSKQWEFESGLAESLGIRVAQVRIGVVLGREGGALAKMLAPFRAGIGGRIGSGKQWMSWIHVDDLVDLLLFPITQKSARGPLNGTAPNPITNAEFTKELAAVLHRPALIPVPGFALKMLFGEMAGVILASERVLPKATQAAGFRFQHPHLREALQNLLT
ncbi:MAG: TIGR01777 family oxidoreductase [Acidobacteriota bacterium]|nr:TIGR01777 family oxidoreductase [Acidobacteriota bacterium]